MVNETAAAGGNAAVAALPPALFIAAHPDDEVLGFGVALAEHVQVGRDTHLLWMTGGGTTSARQSINGATGNAWWGAVHQPAAEGYAPLTVAECAAARIREGLNAVALLCSGAAGAATVHQAGLNEGYTAAQARAAITAVCDAIAPGAAVHLKPHSWLVDDHPDHIAAGAAVKAMVAADPGRFDEPRYYVLPQYWSDPRLASVTESFDNPTDATIAQRVRNACRAYGAWSPPHTYAIGFHSVSGLLTTIQTNPRSLVHR
jgi:LmbE family N-acetylglucosaminyl deacetylase